MTIYIKTHITEEIELKFKPTRLAIKELNGIKYFCKTTKRNIEKYSGSGVYWKKIIKKHGKENIKTLWISDWFYCPHHLQDFALKFSEYNDIVNSDEWANIIPENGLDGAPAGHSGHKFTIEQIKKISENSLSMWKDDEFRQVMSQKQKESWTEERKQEQRNRLSGVKRPDHSIKMSGRILTEEQRKKLRKPKHPDHGKLISASLSGKQKTEEHKNKLRVPKLKVVCRLQDKKEMSLGNFMNWCRIQDKLLFSQEK